MRSSLRRQLLHLAADLSALTANPDDLGHGFDLLTRSYVTPAADAARAALRSDPAIAALVAERYWGPWPSQATASTLTRDPTRLPSTMLRGWARGLAG